MCGWVDGDWYWALMDSEWLEEGVRDAGQRDNNNNDDEAASARPSDPDSFSVALPPSPSLANLRMCD